MKVLSKSDYIICALLSAAFAASPRYMTSGECHVTIGFILSALTSFVFFTTHICHQKNDDETG